MSIAVMSKVFYTNIPSLSYIEAEKGSKITVSATTAKFVLLAIADSADDFGENSYNGYERLGTKTSLGRRSVMRATKALVANGYLENIGTTDYGTNNFKIVLDKLGEPPTTRTRVGRPKEIGDSGAIIGDSGAIIGDSGATDSFLSIPIHPLQQNLQKSISPAKESLQMRDAEEIKKSTEDALFRSYASQQTGYAHYPERVRPVVEKMEKLWYFKPPQSMKGKGQYALWVQSCDEIIDACAEFGVPLLDKLHDDWDLYMESHGGCAPYTISSPKSLVTAVLAKAALLRSKNPIPLWSTYSKQTSQTRLDV
jgi:hypothetical protein